MILESRSKLRVNIIDALECDNLNTYIYFTMLVEDMIFYDVRRKLSSVRYLLKKKPSSLYDSCFIKFLFLYTEKKEKNIPSSMSSI